MNTTDKIFSSEPGLIFDNTDDPIPRHIIQHVVHQQQHIDSQSRVQLNSYHGSPLKQNEDLKNNDGSSKEPTMVESRINFGYYSNPLAESASGLSFKQLKKVTRQLVNSPQYTVNVYNSHFYNNRQDNFQPIYPKVSNSDDPDSFQSNDLQLDITPSPTLPQSSFETHRSDDKLKSPSIRFSTNLRDICSRKIETILHLLPEQNTVVLNENESILAFLQVLDQHGLRSCVIQHDTRRFFCIPRTSFSFADVRDFLYYFVSMHRSWSNRSFAQILSFIKEEKVGNIANISKKSPFVRHDVNDTIASICAGFKPCCRVPIFDKKRLVRVLSPADMLFILNKSDLIKEIEHHSHDSIKKGSKVRIVKLMPSDSLIKAMVLMERYKFSALPIVSERDTDKVLELITVREIKYICLAQDELGSEVIMNQPALKFVSSLRRKGYLKAEAYARLPETASLQEMIDIFLGNIVKNTQSVHRIFLLDDNGKMTGMISLTDVMQNLADLLGEFTRVPSEIQLPYYHPAHNRN